MISLSLSYIVGAHSQLLIPTSYEELSRKENEGVERCDGSREDDKG